MIDTSSLEYVKWMSEVWRLNDERNKKLAEEAARVKKVIDPR